MFEAASRKDRAIPFKNSLEENSSQILKDMDDFESSLISMVGVETLKGYCNIFLQDCRVLYDDGLCFEYLKYFSSAKKFDKLKDDQIFNSIKLRLEPDALYKKDDREGWGRNGQEIIGDSNPIEHKEKMDLIQSVFTEYEVSLIKSQHEFIEARDFLQERMKWSMDSFMKYFK
ncbi:MAG: hypothetical protein COA79_15920 [Planctomycetota bacterium]|nr:MAG: hypothetical protein COA79_15920 [Planctomycetota bacterium]